MRMIARRLGLNFKTVRRYVRVASVDVLLAGGIQVSVLDPFKPYLNDRLADGERNATRLLAEITGQGYPGGYNTLARVRRVPRRERLGHTQLRGALPRRRDHLHLVRGIRGQPGHQQTHGQEAADALESPRRIYCSRSAPGYSTTPSPTGAGTPPSTTPPTGRTKPRSLPRFVPLSAAPNGGGFGVLLSVVGAATIE